MLLRDYFNFTNSDSIDTATAIAILPFSASSHRARRGQWNFHM
jgi:hypothetical protein